MLFTAVIFSSKLTVLSMLCRILSWCTPVIYLALVVPWPMLLFPPLLNKCSYSVTSAFYPHSRMPSFPVSPFRTFSKHSFGSRKAYLKLVIFDWLSFSNNKKSSIDINHSCWCFVYVLCIILGTTNWSLCNCISFV